MRSRRLFSDYCPVFVDVKLRDCLPGEKKLDSDTAPQCVVKLAYLEIMRPSLEEAIASFSKNVKTIRIVPVFLGQGSHLKEDLPRLVAAVRGDYPGVEISLEPAIGEQPRIIEAIAALIAGGGTA